MYKSKCLNNVFRISSQNRYFKGAISISILKSSHIFGSYFASVCSFGFGLCFCSGFRVFRLAPSFLRGIVSNVEWSGVLVMVLLCGVEWSGVVCGCGDSPEPERCQWPGRPRGSAATNYDAARRTLFALLSAFSSLSLAPLSSCLPSPVSPVSPA